MYANYWTEWLKCNVLYHQVLWIFVIWPSTFCAYYLVLSGKSAVDNGSRILKELQVFHCFWWKLDKFHCLFVCGWCLSQSVCKLFFKVSYYSDDVHWEIRMYVNGEWRPIVEFVTSTHHLMIQTNSVIFV